MAATTHHKIGATPLANYATEGGYQLGIGDVAGSSPSIPYQPGLRTGRRTLKGRPYPISLRVIGYTGSTPPLSRAKYLENIQALAQLLLNPDTDGYPQEITLTRILSLTAGTQTCTIRAIYRDGFQVVDSSIWSGTATPVFTLLDAWWLDGSSARVYA